VIPVGAIAVAIRMMNQRHGGATKNEPRAVNLGLRLLASVILIPFTIAFTHAQPGPGAVACVLLAMALLPALTLRALLIPLGLPRTTYWFAFLTPPVAHSAEVRGGAALVGALALGRRRSIDRGTIDWLDLHLARELRLRSLSIAAAGLLAALRGKKETTRLLFLALEGISSRAPRIARRTARSWLVADAAGRGDWKEVTALGRGRGVRLGLRWPYAMGTIASRLTEAAAGPSNAALWFAWLLAPHRRATYPLLRRALAVPRSPERETTPAAARLLHATPSEATDPLDLALRAHAGCLTNPTAESVLAAGHAWDAARDSTAVQSLFARRALALETHTGADAAMSRLLESAEADLAPLVELVHARSVTESAMLDAAFGRAHRRAMEEIETRAAILAERTTDKRALHVSGEWMEWGALRRHCERIGRRSSPSARRATFTVVYRPACDYGAWLFNVRGEKLLANAIFRWLAQYARDVGDATALAVLERNVKVGDGE